MKPLKHWQDPVNALLGAWLALSPWAVGYATETTATYNAVAVGSLLIAAALGAMLAPKAWEEWTEVVLGLWLIAAPRLLGFYTVDLPTAVTATTGVVVVVLALWTLAIDKDYNPWSEERNTPNTRKTPGPG